MKSRKEKRFSYAVFVALFLSVLVLLNFVHAQNTEDITKEAKNISDELKKKSAEIIETEKATEEIQKFTEVFFRVDRTITFSEFVIMAVLFFFIFLLLSYIFPFMPFLNSGIGKWLGSLVVACLVAISGGIYYGAFWLFGLLDSIDFLVKLGPAKTFIILIFIVIIGVALIYVLKLFKGKFEKEQAEMEGMEAGFAVRILKVFKEMFKF